MQWSKTAIGWINLISYIQNKMNNVIVYLAHNIYSAVFIISSYQSMPTKSNFEAKYSCQQEI